MERWDQSGIPQDVSQGDLRMNDSSELYHAPGTRLTWISLLLLTYQLYWKRFWIFFLIALPPVLLAYCFKNAEHFLIQKLKHAGWLQNLPTYDSAMACDCASDYVCNRGYLLVPEHSVFCRDCGECPRKRSCTATAPR